MAKSKRPFSPDDKLRILKEAFLFPKTYYKSEKEYVRFALSSLTGVSDVAREYQISRGTLFNWKKRLLTSGLQGLRDKLPMPKKPSKKVSEGVEARVLALSASRPEWGCKSLSKALRAGGNPVSQGSVQKILSAHGRRTLKDQGAG